VDGMAKSVSSNPLYASIDTEDFENKDPGLRDYATRLAMEVEEEEDDEDADPGYTTVGSESASSVGPFFPRQRILTPPSPLRETDDELDRRKDFQDGKGKENDVDDEEEYDDEDDDAYDDENGEEDDLHGLSDVDKISQARVAPTTTASTLVKPQPRKPRSQSQPIYSKPQKVLHGKSTLDCNSNRGQRRDLVVNALSPSPITGNLVQNMESPHPVVLSSTRREGEEESLSREMAKLRQELAGLHEENAELKRAYKEDVQSSSSQRFSGENNSANVDPDQDQRTQRSIIEALRDLTDSLQNQNRDLELRNIQLNEEIGNLRQALAMRDSEREQAISGAIHEEQNKEMRKEIRSLQTTIQRLSVELSQAQVYSDSLAQREEDQEPSSPLRKNGPCPSWLVNTKYLSPLIGAYDEKLKEKDITLNHCRDELEGYREKLKSLSEENSAWRQKLEGVQEQERERLNQEWTILENHNQLLIRENQILMSQISLKEQKMTSLVESSAEAEARQGSRENQLEVELNVKESEVTSLKEKLANLTEKHEAVVAADEAKMSIEEHVQQLQDLKKLVNDMKENHLREKESFFASQTLVDEENKELQTRLAAAVEEVEAKEKRILQMEKENRKLGKKIAALVAKLAAGKKLQDETEDRLEDVCVALEKSRSDNLTLSSLVEAESDQRNQIVDLFARRSVNIGHMEEKLVNYRNKVGDKLVANASKMQKLDITYTQHRIEYRKRINQLLKVIERKDLQLLKLMAVVKEGGSQNDVGSIGDDIIGADDVDSDLE